MKNFKTFAILFFAATVLSSCGGLNKMVKEADQVSYAVTPEVLEMHGGTVDFSINVNYPAKYFNKKAVVTLTPVLRYEESQALMEPLVLQGEDVTENNKSISFDAGGKASTSKNIEYEDAMMLSELYFNVTAAIKSTSTKILLMEIFLYRIIYKCKQKSGYHYGTNKRPAASNKRYISK